MVKVNNVYLFGKLKIGRILMTLSDLNFIFRAMPLFLILYYLFPAKLRSYVLLVASIAFYALNDYKLLGVLAGATIVNYLFARAISKKKKLFFITALIFNSGLLLGFKVAGRLDSGILLPLGLSFYVFKMISFQVDLYKEKISEVSLVKMAVYYSMFPQIISGPIARYDFVEENTAFTPIESEAKWYQRLNGVLGNVEDGLKYFVIGLFLKVIIADHMAMLWSEIETIGYVSLSTPMAWIGAYAYSMNLYFDFWGYSLMAAGAGVMLGFPFIENFIQPYSANSVSDFYRRWHATLGSWFRDYIYIPLGGSRKGTFRTIINLSVVWFITGLWHGMTWNFLAWAGALLLLILAEKYILSRNKYLFTIVGHFNVWVLIPCTWVIFAIHSIRGVWAYFLRLFPVINNGIAVNQRDFIITVPDYLPYIGLGLLFTLPVLQAGFRKYKDNIITIIILFIMFWVSVFSLANSAGNPFMYLRF